MSLFRKALSVPGMLNSIYKIFSKIPELASDLGIPMSTLATWVKQFKEHGLESFPGSGALKPSDEELYRLCKELGNV